MIELMLAAAIVWPSDTVSVGFVSSFGAGRWDQAADRRLHELVLTRWPSPQALLELWDGGELDPGQQVSLLLGGSAFHDPVLLPAYLEALDSGRPVVRRAAHHGYRNLIGDLTPRPGQDLDDEGLEALRREMRAMQQGLRTGSLVDLWLESLLRHESKSMDRWHGVALNRSPVHCLRSLDRLIHPEDLPELITAFELSTDDLVRQSLMRLIEGTGLQRFVVRPAGERSGWGMKVYREAIERLEYRLAFSCRRDAESWIVDGLRAAGARGARPNTARACGVWRELIRRPYGPWGRTVAQQLYACGAPPIDLSILSARSPSEQQRVERLDRWFPDGGPPGRPTPNPE
jgi:hypothetical protein